MEPLLKRHRVQKRGMQVHMMFESQSSVAGVTADASSGGALGSRMRMRENGTSYAPDVLNQDLMVNVLQWLFFGFALIQDLQRLTMKLYQSHQ